jgi:hypothetical protein
MPSRAERLLLLYADVASVQAQRSRLLLEREILELPGMESGINSAEWQRIVRGTSELTQGWQQRGQQQPELDAELRRFLMAWLGLLQTYTTSQARRFNNEDDHQALRRREVLEPCLTAFWAVHSLPSTAEPGRSWVIDQLLRLTLTISAPCPQRERRDVEVEPW